jgi:nicotinate-nucleotide adenylyltransferase
LTGTGFFLYVQIFYMTDLFNILLPPDKVSMKIGLYFGSFNPVHIGHMAIANYLVEFGDIDQLWFVVSPQSPFKEKQTLHNDYDRLKMAELAVGKDHRFRVSDVEFKLPKPSYTIHTLNHLKERFPLFTFSIIMGADNLGKFSQWKHYEEIKGDYEIIVYPRPGYTVNDNPEIPHLTIVDAPLLEISSTFIREAVSDEKDIRYFLPPKVWDYIQKNKLYSM